MGEDLDHEANQRADFYTELIREIAETEGVAYLPLREKLVEELAQNPSKPRIRYEETVKTVALAALLRHVFGWSYERIAQRYGNRFLTDNLHLNEAGAAVVAELVESFVSSELKNSVTLKTL